MGKLRDRLRTLEDRFVRLEIRLSSMEENIQSLERTREFQDRAKRAKVHADRIIKQHFGDLNEVGLRDDIAKALANFR